MVDVSLPESADELATRETLRSAFKPLIFTVSLFSHLDTICRWVCTDRMYVGAAAAVLWEVLFMLTTTCIVISIITGIICDTFRELRTEVDEARYYRNSTCFVTGIPYSIIEQ